MRKREAEEEEEEDEEDGNPRKSWCDQMKITREWVCLHVFSISTFSVLVQ